MSLIIFSIKKFLFKNQAAHFWEEKKNVIKWRIVFYLKKNESLCHISKTLDFCTIYFFKILRKEN